MIMTGLGTFTKQHDVHPAPSANCRNVIKKIQAPNIARGPIPQREVALKKSQGMQMKMLIVDDVMTNAAVLKRMAMRVFGGDIDIETSSISAINACHERKYDLIITDYHMADLDGISMVNIIRLFFEYKNTPILMISSCSDPAVISKAMRLGINDFMPKPVHSEHFRNKIQYHLSQRPSTYAA